MVLIEKATPAAKDAATNVRSSRRVLLVFSLVLAACVAGRGDSQIDLGNSATTVESSKKNNGSIDIPTPSPTEKAATEPPKKLINLCEDPEADPTDPIEKKNIKNCKCGDPSVGVKSYVHEPDKWLHFHELWLQSVEYTVAASSNHQQPEVCFVGDSLIEHWNGTVQLAKRKPPQLRAVFEKYFATDNLRGLALGASADTSRMLLWHLQHGLLNNTQFQPKVWMILVGTNDLGHGLCSKESTLDGILFVADTIKKSRPDASILIHGLLPRSGDDGNNGKDMFLGRYWTLIQWINAKLQLAVAQRPDFYYMDSGELFISDNGQAINPQYIQDGIHPEASGLEAWGPRIVQKLQFILDQRETSQ